MNTDKYKYKYKNSFSKKKNGQAFFQIFVLLNFIFAVSVFSVFAQTRIVPPNPPKPKSSKIAKKIHNDTGTPTEKSILVDAKVNISLCVSAGKLKINGWQRSEIRAFVSGGSSPGFKVLQKSRQNNNPVWVMVLGFDPSKNDETGADECLSGEEIELDVPQNAVVNVKSSESETTIESVGKVSVENVSGDIFLNKIAQGIEAKTYEGDVTVENSGGAMTLLSTTGNIVALDVSPSEIGNIFKAKTSSGAIVLQKIEHRQLEVGSNSGSIRFVGDFLSGGQYTFGTSNGSILLSIPEKSSSKINALFGFGAFNSDIPLQNIIKNASSKAQNLSAQMGGGDATLNLTTVSGAIRIKKQ